MKALIIDNNSKYLLVLKKIVEDNNFITQINSWSAINYDEALSVDVLLLTGSSKMTVVGHLDDFAEQFKLIQQRVKPTLGICLGAEIIAHTFGTQLKYRADRERGNALIKVIREDKIFGVLKEFEAHEAHKFYIDVLPDNLIPLAESLSGIEVFRHIEHDIYGTQFHPEADTTLSGFHVLHNFLKIAK